MIIATHTKSNYAQQGPKKDQSICESLLHAPDIIPILSPFSECFSDSKRMRSILSPQSMSKSLQDGASSGGRGSAISPWCLCSFGVEVLRLVKNTAPLHHELAKNPAGMHVQSCSCPKCTGAQATLQSTHEKGGQRYRICCEDTVWNATVENEPAHCADADMFHLFVYVSKDCISGNVLNTYTWRTYMRGAPEGVQGSR